MPGVMIRSKLQSAAVGTLAALSLLIMAWLANAGQAVVDRPKAGVSRTARSCGTADLEGNWIVRAYPAGGAIGLIKIEGPLHRSRKPISLSIISAVDLLSASRESKIDHLRIDEVSSRFTLQLNALAGRLMAGSSTSSPIFRKTTLHPRPPGVRWGSSIWTTSFRHVSCQDRAPHRPDLARPQGRRRVRAGRQMTQSAGSTRPKTLKEMARNPGGSMRRESTDEDVAAMAVRRRMGAG